MLDDVCMGMVVLDDVCMEKVVRDDLTTSTHHVMTHDELFQDILSPMLNPVV